NNFTISAPIADNADGAVDFVKAGAGTLLLDGPSTITGKTYISRGVLQMGQFGELQQSTVYVAIADTTGPFNPGAWNKIIGGLEGPGGVSTAAGGVLQIGNNGESTSYSGAITGGGSIVKIGAGTL